MTSCRPVDQAGQEGITYVEVSADATTAVKLGLDNFSLTFNPIDNGWSIQLTNDATGPDPTVTLNADQSAIASVTGSLYSGNSATRIYAYQTGALDFFLSTNDGVTPDLTRGVTWFLSVNTEGPLIIPNPTRPACPLNVAQLASTGETSYSSGETGITIYAETSADGMQLTLARITITENGQSTTDTFYNLKLPCVMCGPGCTLLSKAQGKPIAYVLEYALLKFAVAKLLFGCYWLCYLTREWNQIILDQSRVEYPSFYTTLSSFVGYEELFC